MLMRPDVLSYQNHFFQLKKDEYDVASVLQQMLLIDIKSLTRSCSNNNVFKKFIQINQINQLNY